MVSVINKKINRLQEKVRLLNEEIESLKKACPHINYKAKPNSDTGNWDRFDDSWWVEFCCYDCGLQRIYDSKRNPEEYRRYAR